MVEVLLFVNIGLLVIGSVTLTIAVFVLQRARSYVELSEERLEHLRVGQERLFQMLRKELRSRVEEPARVESLVPEIRQRTEAQDAEQKIEQLEKELRKLRHSRENEPLEQNESTRSGAYSKEPVQNVGLLAQRNLEASDFQRNTKIPPTTKPRETTSVRAQKAPESKKPGFVVKHAHPDDDVSFQEERTKQDSPQNSAPAKMFREHYRRYLENYEGYVKLVERLYRTKEDEVLPSGSPAEREWEQKLRRLNDGIQRTTARLDILEQYNPELASDERVSHRAEIARNYAELEKQLPILEGF